MISRTNDVTSSYWDPLQRCWSSRYLNTTWSSDWWICWVGNNWFNVQPFCSYLQTYVLSSNQQNAGYENGRSVASTKDVYNVLPLNWNKKSCYRNFGDSEEMKKACHYILWLQRKNLSTESIDGILGELLRHGNSAA